MPFGSSTKAEPNIKCQGPPLLPTLTLPPISPSLSYSTNVWWIN